MQNTGPGNHLFSHTPPSWKLHDFGSGMSSGQPNKSLTFRRSPAREGTAVSNSYLDKMNGNSTWANMKDSVLTSPTCSVSNCQVNLSSVEKVESKPD